MLVLHYFVSREYVVDLTFITTFWIFGLSADSISLFLSRVVFDVLLINACFIFIYCNVRVYVRHMCFCLSVCRFIHFSSVLLSLNLKLACSSWFCFSLICSRHYIYHDFLNRWPVCRFNIFNFLIESCIWFFSHQRMFYLHIL